MAHTSVKEYIENSGVGKEELSAFAEFMNTEFPSIMPKISYSMPMWWAGKKIYEGYIGVSAAKAHYSVHFGDEVFLEKLKAALPCQSFGKRCVNVKFGDEETVRIVKEYVKEYFSSVLK